MRQEKAGDLLTRYSRQLVLREVGPEGQRAWLASRVRVRGTGVAAEWATTWLRAAGVGRVEEGEPGLDLEDRGGWGPAEAARGLSAAGRALGALLPEPLGPGPGEGDAAGFEAVGVDDPAVVVVGAGGLGCPAAWALAEAGVRRITLIDDDRVELSNLPRQVLHTTARVGMPKAESAAVALRERFPGIAVRAVVDRLEPGNAESLLAGADLVLEGSDNFPTKYRVNAAASALGVPAVIAGVLRLDGQALAVDPGRGPSARGSACYRCLFPDSPSPGAVPTCSTAGILGPVAGLLGVRQAALGLQLLAARRGERASPGGRFWTYSARSDAWEGFRVFARPDCVACGPEPADPALRGEAEGAGPLCAPRP